MIEINYNSDFKDLITKYPKFWKKKILKEGNSLIEIGDVSKQNIYVETGVIRAYYKHTKVVNGKEKTKEIIIGFFAGSDTILHYRSFVEPITMVFNFDVASNTDAVVWLIDAENWNFIEANEPKLHELMHKEYDKVIRKLLEYSLIRSIAEAPERYEIFMKSRPYADKLLTKHIALYIDVSPDTLSNIKSGNYNN